jgi:hypothetical protein
MGTLIFVVNGAKCVVKKIRMYDVSTFVVVET